MNYVLLIGGIAAWTFIVADLDQEHRDDVAAKAINTLKAMGAGLFGVIGLEFVIELIGPPGLNQWFKGHQIIVGLALWFVAFVVLMFRQDDIRELKRPQCSHCGTYLQCPSCKEHP
jgi:hypothetical protein